MNSTTHEVSNSLIYALYRAELFTIIFISILGILTTILNAFTLYAIYKDPLSCFRTPLTTFITGIIISDLLTGLIVEPGVASLYAIGYTSHNISFQSYQNLLRTTQIFALITMNSSFFTFLALAIAQLLAVGWTGTYEKHVTNKKAKIVIGLIWVYSVLFSLIPEITGMSLRAFYGLDLILNTTIVSILLVTIYMATYVIFRSIIRGVLQQQHPNGPGEQPVQGIAQRPSVKKEFLRGTFLMTCLLIITVLPYTVALYLWIFEVKRDFATVIRRYIAVIICENILFLKFLWDPAVLILRIPIYRKSVVMILSGVIGNNAGGIVAYNRQADEETRTDFQETTIVENQ